MRGGECGEGEEGVVGGKKGQYMYHSFFLSLCFFCFYFCLFVCLFFPFFLSFFLTKFLVGQMSVCLKGHDAPKPVVLTDLQSMSIFNDL